MVSDRLYELAFAYRKTRLWKRLYDTELFAFHAADGTLCCCCVMGQNGQHLALAVYPGQTGLDSFRRILTAGADMEEMSPARCHALLYSQRCLQCSFENREELSPEQLSGVRDYVRRTGRSLGGKNAFPCFLSYQPNRLPMVMEQVEDAQLMEQALAAALDVDLLLRQVRSKEALGFRMCVPCEGEIPLIVDNGMGGAEVSSVTLPRSRPAECPAPVFRDELAGKKLARLPRKGYWQVQAVLSPEPEEDEAGGAPYFPTNLIYWDSVSEMVSITEGEPDGEEQAQRLLQLFCKALLHERRLPEEIQVEDDATFALLADLAEKLGIALTRVDALDVLADVEAQFYSGGTEEDEDEILDQLSVLVHMLSELSAKDLADIPGELREQLMELDAEHLLPPDLSKKLSDAFRPKPGPARRKRPPLTLERKDSEE